VEGMSILPAHFYYSSAAYASKHRSGSFIFVQIDF